MPEMADQVTDVLENGMTNWRWLLLGWQEGHQIPYVLDHIGQTHLMGGG